MIYGQAKDFDGLWRRYMEYVSRCDYLYEKTSGPDEKETHRAEIKHAQTLHLREGKETALHHIFINMNPKTSEKVKK